MRSMHVGQRPFGFTVVGSNAQTGQCPAIVDAVTNKKLRIQKICKGMLVHNVNGIDVMNVDFVKLMNYEFTGRHIIGFLLVAFVTMHQAINIDFDEWIFAPTLY
eukprot:407684_1